MLDRVSIPITFSQLPCRVMFVGTRYLHFLCSFRKKYPSYRLVPLSGWPKYRIGGSKGGTRDVPSRSKFFHFHAVFWKKNGQIIGCCPHLESWHLPSGKYWIRPLSYCIRRSDSSHEEPFITRMTFQYWPLIDDTSINTADDPCYYLFIRLLSTKLLVFVLFFCTTDCWQIFPSLPLMACRRTHFDEWEALFHN